MARAVEVTAAWYRSVMFEKADAQECCLADITTYLEAVRARGEWWGE